MKSVNTARALRAAALLSSVVLLSGCLSMKSYVDPTLPVVGKNDVVAPATPRPVQVAFEFRTKGSANAAATAELQPRVIAVAAESGLFSRVSKDPAGADGGLLTVMIDNVEPDGQNAAGKGFGTGLTFGAVGSMVTDAYNSTMTYEHGGKTTKVDVSHALHTTIGNKKGPEGLTPMTPQQAIQQVVDQLIWNGLEGLSEQKAFD